MVQTVTLYGYNPDLLEIISDIEPVPAPKGIDALPPSIRDYLMMHDAAENAFMARHIEERPAFATPHSWDAVSALIAGFFHDENEDGFLGR